MKSIFVPDVFLEDGFIFLKDSYFINYIKNVLRLGVGDFLIILSNDINYEGKITEVGKKRIVLEVKDSNKVIKKDRNVILLQSLIKLERFEIVLEKAIELGVSKIIPIISSRCKMQEINWDNKLKRFNKIIMKALTQSKQNTIPSLERPLRLKDIDLDLDLKIFFDKDDNLEVFNSDTKINKEIAIFIGPEGGLCEDEKLVLKSKGFLAYRLNLPVLRSETAAIVSLAFINMRLNDG